MGVTLPSTYANRAAERKEDTACQKIVHGSNICLYVGWAIGAGYRAAAWVNAVIDVFRKHPPAWSFAPKTLSGTPDTLIQAAAGAGVAFALWEFVVTLVVFGKDAHKYARAKSQRDDHQVKRLVINDYIEAQKNASHDAKEAAKAAGSPLPFGPPSAPLPKGDTDAMVSSFLEYEAACIDLPAAANKLKHSSWMFARDGIAQGASIGCTLSLMWEKYKVAELLRLAAAPIDAGATSICGGALSIAGGILHIVAGALALSDGKEKLSLAGRAKTNIKQAITRLEEAKQGLRAREAPAADGANPDGDHSIAAMTQALGITECLLTKAKANEKLAKKKARHDIFVAKWRIGFGTVATILGGVSLTLLLVVGGVTTGGLIFGVLGALALAGWTLYASHRNKKYLGDLEAAKAAVQQTGPMALDDAIENAAQLFDRGRFTADEWLTAKDARRQVKQALLTIGMKRRDFHALRFGAVFRPSARDKFRDVLKIKIHHHVAADGARRAIAAEPGRGGGAVAAADPQDPPVGGPPAV